MESSEENTAALKKSLMELEKWFKEGKDRNDAKVKEMEDKIRTAFNIPKESWINTGKTLKDVIEHLNKFLGIVQNSVSSEKLSDKDVLKNASGGLALEGLYKTINPKDLLKKREQLIETPDSFTLTGPTQNPRYEQKEFTSHKSETVFHKVMEKLGHSFSCSVNIGVKSFGLEFGVEESQFSEKEETSSYSKEESYMLQTKYDYIPLASGFFQKDKLKLSTGALKALKEIEKVILNSNECKTQIQKVRSFFERFGSHVNQGPLHFGGIFWWRASASGFKSNDLSEVKKLISESLNVYSGAEYGFSLVSVSGKATISSTHLRGSFTGKHREDLMSQVQLSVSKSGGPDDIDNHLLWKSHLVANNRTWSIIDKGTTLVPVWEIVMESHRPDFKDVSKLITILMEAYMEITKEKVEKVSGENVLSEVENAETLIESVKNWSASECESHLRQLFDFKTKLYYKTRSHQIWFLKCLSNEILQNYLFEVTTVHSKSTAGHLRIMMRSLLEPDLYELEKFPNRKEIIKWAYHCEEDYSEQISVSEYSDLDKILQFVKELEDSKHMFSTAEQEQIAKQEATITVTLSLNSFCKSLGENDKKEAELLIQSIINTVGYKIKNKTFDHILDVNEITFLQSELHKAFSMYSSLKQQCAIKAQAYVVHTALTISTNKDQIKISHKAKRERLQLIQTELKNKLSSHIESVIEKNHDDYQTLESALWSIITGTQIIDGTDEEADSQLEIILRKEMAPISEVHKTDGQNTPANNQGKITTEFMDLLVKLGLHDSYPKKMTKANVLVTNSLSLSVKELETEKDLSSLYLYKLMTLDYRARYLFVKPEVTTRDHEEDCANDNDDDGDDDDFFDFHDKSETRLTRKQLQIHPMDMHMAIFHCSNDFLRQYIFTKLSACQYSLPFLVPNPCTDEVEFPLWALRHIRKSWKSKMQTDSSSDGKYHNRQMFNTPVPVVSFIRFGVSDSNSKSQIMDAVINKQKHSVFFHRHCKGSTKDSLLMNGVVEIAWYCPGGKEDDVFDECLAFLNLRGDATEHLKQLKFLQAVSTVIVLLLSEQSMSETAKEVSQKLSKSPLPLICLFSGKDSVKSQKNPINNQQSKKTPKVRLAAKNRNQAEFTEELISSIKQCIRENKQTATIERCCEEARKLKFRVDEDNQSCQDGYAKAQTLMCLLKDEKLSKLKERILPLQGKLWHDWSNKHKEQYRLKIKENENIQQQQSTISAEMEKIRRKQCETAKHLNDFMRSFLECLTTPVQFEDTNLYMLQWLRILLDDFTTDKIASLEEKYHSTWREIRNVPKNKENASVVEGLQKNLDKITDTMAATTIGLQHIMREVSQIYEAFQMHFTKTYSTLPKIGARMLLFGYPLEIMDGDASHVPITWIQAVMDELINTIGDKKVFVLSILGIQSSGKSTLLNTMFGLQFAVSAGRCTRGAFMQLVDVDSKIKNKLGYDFILILDTEGLRSPELSTKTSLNHDNELATFIIGIGDTTVINIMGENTSEMQDILQICVQAFLRMKQVKITPSCIFVHQNVSEASAREKNNEGRRRLLEKLGEMARLAAKEENVDGITCFSDVIHFDVEKQVFYFTNLLEGDPPMAPPNPSYSQNVQKLKTKLLTIASWKDSCKFSTLSEFKCRVSDLWTALLQENFVFSFKNTVEMMVYTSLENKYGEWSWKLRKHSLSLQTELENKIGSNLIQDVTSKGLINNYSTVYDPLKNEIEKYFTEDKNKETLIKWKVEIAKRFDSLKNELIHATQKNCNDLLVSKKNKSKLDEMKTTYMGELTEKSKKLASELKTSHPTDKKIEDEFDKLWVKWTTEVLNSLPTENAINVKALVEGVLLDKFGNFAGIQNKIKSGSFKFDEKQHIQKGCWETFKDLFRRHGDFAHELMVLTNQSINYAVHEYITEKENDKKDFDENFIYEILSIIDKDIVTFEEKQDKLKLTNEFKVDLSVYICLRNVWRFEKMHEVFKTANDPVTYLQGQRQKYLQSFKNYCKGASSVNIFVDFLCKHITPEVLKAANEKLSQQIADEMMCNNGALNGNRSNLEYNILKHLADKENFSMYEEYIDFPKQYFKRFIQEKLNEFLGNDKKLHTLHQENLKSLKNHILTESIVISTEVDEKSGSASMWLDLFCDTFGHLITIRRDELQCIESETITDWTFFNDIMAKSMEEVVKEKQMDVEKLRKKTTDILFHQLEGCWAQCPFCKAICTNTIPNHDGDHSVKFHRSEALTGYHYENTDNFVIHFCTTAVNSEERFRPGGKTEWTPYKKYRDAGDPHNKWKITGEGSTQSYWKWFICNFRSHWEKKYGYKFIGLGNIPKEWEYISKESALEELEV